MRSLLGTVIWAVGYFQRIIAQRKEETRHTQNQINKEEIGKLSKKEFRVLILKMF